MELPQHIEKCAGFAQNARSQQIGLRIEGSCFQTPVIAFAHDPLHVFMRDLEILQKRAFERAAAVRVFGNIFDPLQWQCEMTVLNRFPE